MNPDTLNRYVLGVIGVFVLLLYLGMMFAGCSELIAWLSKPGPKGGDRRPLPVER